MANTLKFGNGQWATQEGLALAYNDENDNYKPLPFTFDRASTATRVNKQGLIETVASGLPRIDYLNNTNGALLLEPASTNLIIESNQFNTSWSTNAVTLQDNQSGVSGGLNAWKITEDTSTSQHFVQLASSLTAATEQTVTIYAKAAERNYLMLNQGGVFRTYYDLVNGTVVSSGTGVTASMESMPNGWWRCIYTATMTYTSLRVCVNDDGSSNSYTGDGVSGIYIQYCQNETLSYPTSYIPTQGSAVTRLADSCSQTPPDGVIGQTEGTMFLDFNIDDISSQTQDPVLIYLKNSSGITTYFEMFDNGDFVAVHLNSGSITLTKNGLIDGRHKAAFAYKDNDFAFYVDGILAGTNTSFTVASSQTEVGLQYTSTFYTGKQSVNEAKLYNTRLSNSELAALTQV